VILVEIRTLPIRHQGVRGQLSFTEDNKENEVLEARKKNSWLPWFPSVEQLHHKRLMMQPAGHPRRSEVRGLIRLKNKKLEPKVVVFFVSSDPEPRDCVAFS